MKRLMLITILWVGALFLLRLALGQRPDRRNFEYYPDMAQSFAFVSQSENPFLPGGYTQQPAPEGTIARGHMPLPFGSSEQEALRAGELLQNPYRNGAQPDMARARKLYETWCQICHGAGGKGDGPVTRRGFPPPPSLLLDRAKNMKDGQIFHIITFGFKNMPAYGSQISRKDRWMIIEYVRKLQESQP